MAPFLSDKFISNNVFPILPRKVELDKNEFSQLAVPFSWPLPEKKEKQTKKPIKWFV